VSRARESRAVVAANRAGSENRESQEDQS
jgi:hypothetical protein